MPGKKITSKSKEKRPITPLNTETEDAEKELDPDLIAGEPEEGVDADDIADLIAPSEDSEFDEDELNPFKDKWEE
jgi:hypothetical protein